MNEPLTASSLSNGHTIDAPLNAQVSVPAQLPAPELPVQSPPNTPSGASLAVNDAVKQSQNPKQVSLAPERKLLENKVKSCCVMIVDDEEAVVEIVRQHLIHDGYVNFVTTTDSRKVQKLAEEQEPDLVLLDIRMPHINGLEILQAFAADPKMSNVPVVVLTAASDPRIKRMALDLGANDFLTKPVDPNALIPRVRNSLMIKSQFDQMAEQTSQLETTVKRRTDELFQSRQQIILSLARAAEHRDNETGNHVLRVGFFAAIIAKQLGWKADEVEMIQQAAQLHDVGKIGISDTILFKPGKLEEDEFDLMKKHCSLGTKIISPYDSRDLELLRRHTRLGENILHIRTSPLMMMAARIAQTHHENWDGTGYPLGLAEEDIPLEGRITAVADVYDALSSERPYKAAFPRKKCFEIMIEMCGKKFDPKILNAFFECSKEIVEIQMAFLDE